MTQSSLKFNVCAFDLSTTGFTRKSESVPFPHGQGEIMRKMYVFPKTDNCDKPMETRITSVNPICGTEHIALRNYLFMEFPRRPGSHWKEAIVENTTEYESGGAPMMSSFFRTWSDAQFSTSCELVCRFRMSALGTTSEIPAISASTRCTTIGTGFSEMVRSTLWDTLSFYNRRVPDSPMIGKNAASTALIAHALLMENARSFDMTIFMHAALQDLAMFCVVNNPSMEPGTLIMGKDLLRIVQNARRRPRSRGRALISKRTTSIVNKVAARVQKLHELEILEWCNRKRVQTHPETRQDYTVDDAHRAQNLSGSDLPNSFKSNFITCASDIVATVATNRPLCEAIVASSSFLIPGSLCRISTRALFLQTSNDSSRRAAEIRAAEKSAQRAMDESPEASLAEANPPILTDEQEKDAVVMAITGDARIVPNIDASSCYSGGDRFPEHMPVNTVIQGATSERLSRDRTAYIINRAHETTGLPKRPVRSSDLVHERNQRGGVFTYENAAKVNANLGKSYEITVETMTGTAKTSIIVDGNRICEKKDVEWDVNASYHIDQYAMRQGSSMPSAKAETESILRRIRMCLERDASLRTNIINGGCNIASLLPCEDAPVEWLVVGKADPEFSFVPAHLRVWSVQGRIDHRPLTINMLAQQVMWAPSQTNNNPVPTNVRPSVLKTKTEAGPREHTKRMRFDDAVLNPQPPKRVSTTVRNAMEPSHSTARSMSSGDSASLDNNAMSTGTVPESKQSISAAHIMKTNVKLNTTQTRMCERLVRLYEAAAQPNSVLKGIFFGSDEKSIVILNKDVAFGPTCMDLSGGVYRPKQIQSTGLDIIVSDTKLSRQDIENCIEYTRSSEDPPKALLRHLHNPKCSEKLRKAIFKMATVVSNPYLTQANHSQADCTHAVIAVGKRGTKRKNN